MFLFALTYQDHNAWDSISMFSREIMLVAISTPGRTKDQQIDDNTTNQTHRRTKQHRAKESRTAINMCHRRIKDQSTNPGKNDQKTNKCPNKRTYNRRRSIANRHCTHPENRKKRQRNGKHKPPEITNQNRIAKIYCERRQQYCQKFHKIKALRRISVSNNTSMLFSIIRQLNNSDNIQKASIKNNFSRFQREKLFLMEKRFRAPQARDSIPLQS